jgi:hypothetical protein
MQSHVQIRIPGILFPASRSRLISTAARLMLLSGLFTMVAKAVLPVQQAYQFASPVSLGAAAEREALVRSTFLRKESQIRILYQLLEAVAQREWTILWGRYAPWR